MKHTDLILILDRSGSMARLKADVEGGFDRMVREQAGLEGTCNVTLVQFDAPDGPETVYTGKPVREVPPLVLEPRGGTPLLDAVGATVSAVAAQIARLPADQRPEQVVVAIITDGVENASREYQLADVRRLIEERQRAGWTFVYLGANVDAFAEAHRLGISALTAAPYQHSHGGVQAMFCSVSDSMARYRTGEDSSYHFTSAQRKAMANAGRPDPDLYQRAFGPPEETEADRAARRLGQAKEAD